MQTHQLLSGKEPGVIGETASARDRARGLRCGPATSPGRCLGSTPGFRVISRLARAEFGVAVTGQMSFPSGFGHTSATSASVTGVTSTWRKAQGPAQRLRRGEKVAVAERSTGAIGVVSNWDAAKHLPQQGKDDECKVGKHRRAVRPALCPPQKQHQRRHQQAQPSP